MSRGSKWDVEKMKAKGDVAGLMEALKVKDYTVRRNAAMALGNKGDTKALESLIEALKDEDDIVRLNAAKALGNIGGDRAIISLIENMFTNPGDLGSADSLRKLLPETNFTAELFNTAIKAAKYPPSETSENAWNQSGFLEDLNEAIEELCNRPSPISTNLLILISQKKDASMTLKICSGYQERKVSFDFSKQRKRATFELTRRHFETYESASFLKSSRELYGYM